MGPIFCIIAIILCFIYLGYFFINRTMEKFDKENEARTARSKELKELYTAQGDLWLSLENTKPRFGVEVKTIDGGPYTSYFSPSFYVYHGFTSAESLDVIPKGFRKESSEDRAIYFAAEIIRVGKYVHEEITIPTSAILSITVIQETK